MLCISCWTRGLDNHSRGVTSSKNKGYYAILPCFLLKPFQMLHRNPFSHNKVCFWQRCSLNSLWRQDVDNWCVWIILKNRHMQHNNEELFHCHPLLVSFKMNAFLRASSAHILPGCFVQAPCRNRTPHTDNAIVLSESCSPIIKIKHLEGCWAKLLLPDLVLDKVQEEGWDCKHKKHDMLTVVVFCKPLSLKAFSADFPLNFPSYRPRVARTHPPNIIFSVRSPQYLSLKFKIWRFLFKTPSHPQMFKTFFPTRVCTRGCRGGGLQNNRNKKCSP